MKVGERGQVTIPKEIRDKFGIAPDSEVVFQVIDGSIILKKISKTLDLAKWKGHCRESFDELGYSTVDEFIEDIRGR